MHPVPSSPTLRAALPRYDLAGVRSAGIAQDQGDWDFAAAERWPDDDATELRAVP